MSIELIIFSIVALPILGIIAYYMIRSFYDTGREVYGYFYSQMLPMPEAHKQVLQKYHHFYKALNQADKRKFEERVKVFMFNKEFIARQMPEVTDEMRVLISASAIQLTFGLHFTFFTHFRKILVYPDSYYSTINKRYHQGEVNPKLGLIIISWKNFVEGFIQHNDGRNLGLHEMAHALKLDSRVHPILSPKSLREWYDNADHYLRNQERAGLFRNYAFTNHHEFFAVAVENFFERPHEFQQLKPELYNSLVYLLRLNPAKILSSR